MRRLLIILLLLAAGAQAQSPFWGPRRKATVGPTTQSGTVQPQMLQGLVQFYKMDETGGSANRVDALGGAGVWSVTGTVSGTTGLHGNAASVSTGNYMDIAKSSVFPNGASAPTAGMKWSHAFWFNASDLGNVGFDSPIVAANGTTQGFDTLFLNGSSATIKVAFYVMTSSCSTTKNYGSALVGGWHLLVVTTVINTSTNATHTLYLDNLSPVTCTGGSGLGTGPGAETERASWNTLVGMTGLVDDYAIFYGNALSQAEVNWIWNNGSGRLLSEYPRY